MVSVDKSSDFLPLNNKVKELRLSDPKLISNLDDSLSSLSSDNINFRHLG